LASGQAALTSSGCCAVPGGIGLVALLALAWNAVLNSQTPRAAVMPFGCWLFTGAAATLGRLFHQIRGNRLLRRF
jgi:hypothetical protein